MKETLAVQGDISDCFACNTSNKLSHNLHWKLFELVDPSSIEIEWFFFCSGV